MEMTNANESDDFEEISSGEDDQLLPDAVNEARSYNGYLQRRQVTQDGNFIYPDRGTFLSFRYPTDDEYAGMENPTAVALRICEERVLRPYNRLLKLVGWQPWIDASVGWHKCVNVGYVLFICAVIILGYIVQYETCFRRDRAGEGMSRKWAPIGPSTNVTPSSVPQDCQELIVSQYIFPDLLHSAAYAYSFWVLRILQTEQIPMLTEKVFLKTSATQSGFLSQKNLIKRLRYVLWGGFVWVGLSQVATIIHVIAQFNTMDFHVFENAGLTGRIAVVIVMCISFLPLDLVYLSVVINYCMQCSLVICFVEGLQTRIRMKSTNLFDARQEMVEIQSHIKFMNHYPATAVSIIMVNFSMMIISGCSALFESLISEQLIMFAATVIAVILWSILMVIPLVWGARVTATCNSMTKIGHELRCRPFGYEVEHITDDELDSFLLYTSSISMKAKLFLIPVRSRALVIILVILVVFITALLQAGIIDFNL